MDSCATSSAWREEPRSRARTPASPSTRARVNAQGRSTRCSGDASRGARERDARAPQLFAAYVDAKQEQNVLDYDDLLLYWHAMMATALAARDRRSGSTTCWWTSTRTPIGCRRRSCAR